MKYVVLLLFVVLSSSLVVAAPVISDAQGVFVDGQSITISGVGFGVKSPVEPLMWDDFENGNLGSEVRTPVIGDDWLLLAIKPHYTNADSWAGGQSAYFEYIGGNGGLSQTFDLSQYVFGSAKIRWQHSNPTDYFNNRKFFRFTGYDEGWYEQNLYFHADPYLFVGEDRVMGGGNFDPDYTMDVGYYTAGASMNAIASAYLEDNNWHTIDLYGRASTPDVANGMMGTVFDGTISTRDNILSVTTAAYNSGYSSFSLGGYLETTSCELFGLHPNPPPSTTCLDPSGPVDGYYLWVDDVYVDTTLARVMICDNAQFQTTNFNCEIQIPHMTWTDSQILVTVNQGRLQDGNSYYLYVVDEDGVVSNPFELVIGSSSEPVTEPTIYSVSDTTLTDGQSVSITGAGFGVKSPVAPLLWDDFEDGVAGLSTNDPSLPSATRYTHRTHGPVMYNDGSYLLNGPLMDISAYSGNLFLHSRRQTEGAPEYPNYNYGGFNAAVFLLPEPTDEIYVSYYWRYDQYPDLYNRMQMKQSRILTSESANYYTGPGQYMQTSFFDVETSPGVRSVQNADIDSFDVSADDGTRYRAQGVISPAHGEWQRVEMYKKDSTPGLHDGTLWATTGLKVVLDEPAAMTKLSSTTWRMEAVNLGMMMDGCGTSTNPSDECDSSQSVDNYYIDTTRARIEIANNIIFEDATRREIQIPVSGWDDGTGRNIVFTVNQGSFTSNDDVYLYVIDEDGVASDGFGPLIFDESGVGVCTDADNDGYNVSGVGCGLADCRDSNPNIFPGALEICGNYVDEDCSGSDLACPVGDLDGNGVVNLADLDAVITLRDLLVLGRALLS